MTVDARSTGSRILVGTVFLLLLVLVFTLVSPYLDLQYLELQRSDYLNYYDRNPVTVVLCYMVIATACIGLALPVTGAAALLAGALFGFPIGLLTCTAASLVGATMVFLWSRYLFRDWLRERFPIQFSIVNRGIEKEGAYYLFSVRLLMVLPFFMVNLICGLTNLGLRVYVVITLLSNTIVLAVLVYAGSTLASLDARSGVITPVTFVSLALIGLAPLILHRIILLVYRYSAGDC